MHTFTISSIYIFQVTLLFKPFLKTKFMETKNILTGNRQQPTGNRQQATGLFGRLSYAF